MGTRADFYVGKGKDAEWLGSVAWDGYPDGYKEHPEVLMAQNEDAFRMAVREMLEVRDDGTTPDMGWPWPWDDSCTTDYSYLFADGQVWASCFGHQLFDCKGGEVLEDEDEDGPKIEFPDMKERQNVTMGDRSGVILITTPGKERT